MRTPDIINIYSISIACYKVTTVMQVNIGEDASHILFLFALEKGPTLPAAGVLGICVVVSGWTCNVELSVIVVTTRVVAEIAVDGKAVVSGMQIMKHVKRVLQK